MDQRSAGVRKTVDGFAGSEGAFPSSRDDGDAPVAHHPPGVVRPHGCCPLVDPHEHHVVGRSSLEHRRAPTHGRTSRSAGARRSPAPARARRDSRRRRSPGYRATDQRPLPHGHGAGGRSGERRARSPRRDDRVPRRTSSATRPARCRDRRPPDRRTGRVRRAPRCPANAPASGSGPAARRRPDRTGRTTRAACATASSGRCRAAAVVDDVGGTVAGGGREERVLRLVAGMQLVATHQREGSDHARSVRRAANGASDLCLVHALPVRDDRRHAVRRAGHGRRVRRLDRRVRSGHVGGGDARRERRGRREVRWRRALRLPRQAARARRGRRHTGAARSGRS